MDSIYKGTILYTKNNIANEIKYMLRLKEKWNVMEYCDWCNISAKEKQWLLFSTEYWDIYLANEQDYVGRSILVLKRHCGNLSEMNMSEWGNLKEIIDCMEFCYKEILDANLCNWS